MTIPFKSNETIDAIMATVARVVKAWDDANEDRMCDELVLEAFCDSGDVEPLRELLILYGNGGAKPKGVIDVKETI